MMIFRRASRMSSIFSRLTLAEHGPTRLMLSMLAAISAVETRSRLVGMVIEPVVWSFFECRSISILSDAACFLQFSQVKFWSEKSFCLPENCADYVGFFYNAFYFESCKYNVLNRKCLGCSRKYALPDDLFIDYLLIT